MTRHRYRLEASHCFDGKQVNRKKSFLEKSDQTAKKKFEEVLESDSTIHEAALFAVAGDRLVTERTRYF